MSDFLEALFHTTKVKDFVKLVKEEIEKKYQDPLEFVKDIAGYLPLRLYERYYQDTVPHSLFGLTSACLVQSLFPQDRRWRPFIQQSWFITKERKRLPLDVDGTPARKEGSLQERWEQFEEAADGGRFEEALAWAKGFLEDSESRAFFRRKSLHYSIKDTFQGGQKFLYLLQMWRLAELLAWNHTEKILCPALHFLVLAPKDRSLCELVEDSGARQLKSLADNKGELPSRTCEELEQTILFSDDGGEALKKLASLAASGAGFEAVRQALLAAACQAVTNCDAGEWVWPIRAFHVACAVGELSDWKPEEKTRALFMAAALLHQASRRSREVDENRQLDEVARRLCPVDPFNVLRSVVSHSDPHASATAVYAILGMSEDRKKELFQTLADLAVKNDPDLCYSHDLLFTYEAAQSYQKMSLQSKDRLPIVAAFFLGRARKRYELFGEYGF